MFRFSVWYTLNMTVPTPFGGRRSRRPNTVTISIDPRPAAGGRLPFPGAEISVTEHGTDRKASYFLLTIRRTDKPGFGEQRLTLQACPHTDREHQGGHPPCGNPNRYHRRGWSTHTATVSPSCDSHSCHGWNRARVDALVNSYLALLGGTPLPTAGRPTGADVGDHNITAFGEPRLEAFIGAVTGVMLADAPPVVPPRAPERSYAKHVGDPRGHSYTGEPNGLCVHCLRDQWDRIHDGHRPRRPSRGE